MTVKELIEWLEGMSQDAEVKLYTETAGEKVTLDAIVGTTNVVTLIGDGD